MCRSFFFFGAKLSVIDLGGKKREEEPSRDRERVAVRLFFPESCRVERNFYFFFCFPKLKLKDEVVSEITADGYYTLFCYLSGY